MYKKYLRDKQIDSLEHLQSILIDAQDHDDPSTNTLVSADLSMQIHYGEEAPIWIDKRSLISTHKWFFKDKQCLFWGISNKELSLEGWCIESYNDLAKELLYNGSWLILS